MPAIGKMAAEKANVASARARRIRSFVAATVGRSHSIRLLRVPWGNRSQPESAGDPIAICEKANPACRAPPLSLQPSAMRARTLSIALIGSLLTLAGVAALTACVDTVGTMNDYL